MRRQAAAASRRSLAELRERWLARADDLRDDGAHDLAAVLVEAIEELEDARPPALPVDQLWTAAQAAAFFQRGENWLRQHVPYVALPGAGTRRARRYRPETCRALAAQCETLSRPTGTRRMA